MQKISDYPIARTVVLAGVLASNMAVIATILTVEPPPEAPGPRRSDDPALTRPVGPPRSDRAANRLWEAICAVESGGDRHALGDNSDSWGIAQISSICLRDCNRIVGYRKWTEQDRFSPAKSREMFDLYLNHYCPDGTDEERARIWNGGPRGALKTCTLKYWAKVQAELRKGK